jgi:ankyrin repeat protein
MKAMNINSDFFDLVRAIEMHPDEFELAVQDCPAILEATGPHKETLLHWLAVENRLESVKLLSRLGAKIDAVNEFGNTPLMECSQIGYQQMVLLLLELGANTCFQSSKNKNTPLHMAAESGRKEVYGLLISKGANPLLKNDYGETPEDLLRFNKKWVKS